MDNKLPSILGFMNDTGMRCARRVTENEIDIAGKADATDVTDLNGTGQTECVHLACRNNMFSRVFYRCWCDPFLAVLGISSSEFVALHSINLNTSSYGISRQWYYQRVSACPGQYMSC